MPNAISSNKDSSMANVSDQVAEHVVAHGATQLATKTSIGAGVGAMVVAGVGLQDWLMIVGLITTIGTFAVNWYYQRIRTLAAIKASTDYSPDSK